MVELELTLEVEAIDSSKSERMDIAAAQPTLSRD